MLGQDYFELWRPFFDDAEETFGKRFLRSQRPNHSLSRLQRIGEDGSLLLLFPKRCLRSLEYLLSALVFWGGPGGYRSGFPGLGHPVLGPRRLLVVSAS